MDPLSLLTVRLCRTAFLCHPLWPDFDRPLQAWSALLIGTLSQLVNLLKVCISILYFASFAYSMRELANVYLRNWIWIRLWKYATMFDLWLYAHCLKAHTFRHWQLQCQMRQYVFHFIDLLSGLLSVQSDYTSLTHNLYRCHTVPGTSECIEQKCVCLNLVDTLHRLAQTFAFVHIASIWRLIAWPLVNWLSSPLFQFQ